mmetsp:Transcript_65334/g.128837  ORF Transcript_65334/g.128837 Transcript_65334/m.128837 type:complete len:289 (-) Transcript_65334:740-1606(-)
MISLCAGELTYQSCACWSDCHAEKLNSLNQEGGSFGSFHTGTKQSTLDTKPIFFLSALSNSLTMALVDLAVWQTSSNQPARWQSMWPTLQTKVSGLTLSAPSTMAQMPSDTFQPVAKNGTGKAYTCSSGGRSRLMRVESKAVITRHNTPRMRPRKRSKASSTAFNVKSAPGLLKSGLKSTNRRRVCISVANMTSGLLKRKCPSSTKKQAERTSMGPFNRRMHVANRSKVCMKRANTATAQTPECHVSAASGGGDGRPPITSFWNAAAYSAPTRSAAQIEMISLALSNP